MDVLRLCCAVSPLWGLLVLAPAFAEEQPSPHAARAERPATQDTQATTPPNPLPPAKTTSHVLNLPDRTLNFSAIAGAVPIFDGQSGTHEADIAFTAFLLDGTDTSTRPLTFVFNGGPGAGSAWLDLGGLGPWRLPIDLKALSASLPPKVVDNTETWLDFTDLVFIDPPGTGYSRILSKDGDIAKHFYSIEGDIDVLAVVIRKWLDAHQRLTSPIYITGESYGGFRAPKLARKLEDQEGIGVKGLIMISPVLDFDWFEGNNNPLITATRLPSLAAAARGLAGDDIATELLDVEAYAKGPYLADLLAGKSDNLALDRMSAKVAGLLGLDPAFVRRLGGRISAGTFAREKHRDEGLAASVYDGDVVGLDAEPYATHSDSPEPVLDVVKTPLARAMAEVSATKLGWPIDARYEILNRNVNRQWDFGKPGRPEVLSDLQYVLAADPKLKVIVAHGAADLVTPYFASKLLIAQLPPLGGVERVQLKLYGGGHMLYLDEASRKALRGDAERLIEGK